MKGIHSNINCIHCNGFLNQRLESGWDIPADFLSPGILRREVPSSLLES